MKTKYIYISLIVFLSGVLLYFIYDKYGKKKEAITEVNPGGNLDVDLPPPTESAADNIADLEMVYTSANSDGVN